MGSAAGVGEQAEAAWTHMFTSYSAVHPDLAGEYVRRMQGRLPSNWKDKLPVYSHTDTKAVATRNRSEEVLNIIAASMPELMGGSADLSGSNLTVLKCSGDFQHANPIGRYIRFGVREHAMVAICNGLFAHGGIRPFCATFLNFLGYAMGSVRVSCLSRFGLLFIMTHDSIGLGEDGPTHQPIEMLEWCRALPNMLTIRPADGNETVGAYIVAIEKPSTPTVLSLTRQGVPTIEGTCADKVSLGAYTIGDFGAAAARPSLILIGTGSELYLAVAVAKSIASSDGVSVRYIQSALLYVVSCLMQTWLGSCPCHARSCSTHNPSRTSCQCSPLARPSCPSRRRGLRVGVSTHTQCSASTTSMACPPQRHTYSSTSGSAKRTSSCARERCSSSTSPRMPPPCSIAQCKRPNHIHISSSY